MLLVKRVLDQSIRVLYARRGPAIAIFLTLFLPLALVGALLAGLAREGFFNQLMALVVLLHALAISAVLALVATKVPPQTASLAATLGRGLPPWWRLVIARQAANFLVVLGLLFFIVPGVLLSIRFAFLEVAIVTEGRGIVDAMATSFRRTRGHGWQIVGLALVLSLVFLVALIPVLFLLFFGDGWAAAVQTGCMILLMGLLEMVHSVVMFCLYVETSPTETEQLADGEDERSRWVAAERVVFPLAATLTILLALSPAIRSSVVDWADLPSGSMMPALVPGDRVLVDKRAYNLKLPFSGRAVLHWVEPRRGDVVVFNSPVDGQLLLKRLVGVAGDTVEVRSDRLWINGELMGDRPDDEGSLTRGPFIGSSQLNEHLEEARYQIVVRDGSPNFGPFLVPPGHVFMLGDNRSNSRDSRYFGPVDNSDVVGRVTLVVLSVDGIRPRWGRFLTTLS